jgi:ketosteroid isomerase-like protein
VGNPDVSVEDVAVAKLFLDALADAASTGNGDAVEPFLAADVEWLTPRLVLHGADETRERLAHLGPPDNLDVEFDEPELVDLGNGEIVTEVREVYRMKATRELAYTRERRIELTIRDGKIARCEQRFSGS